MTEHSVVHNTFVIERTYNASPARVFSALSDPVKKRRWFAEGEGFVIDEFTTDFRVNGLELTRFRPVGGPPMRNDCVYQDIVHERRIVFVYTMMIGDKRISSSLATMEIVPVGDKTQLVYTEQGAYFDGADQPKNREEGCRELLGKLEEELQNHP
ncbi:MAG: polyketide cyclase [Polyangiaceae bacterium]|nr:polyketide cyclase [Polyangiaceae bacterium]